MRTSQIIHIGGRDFDDAERNFIKGSGITTYTVQDIHSDNGLLKEIVSRIQSDRIYIHLDLDVTDPEDFPHTPLPVEGGLHCNEIYDLLDASADRLAGLGIFEYAPSGTRNAFIEKLIQFGKAL